MSLNYRLLFFSPLASLVFYLAICICILMIFFPKAVLRRRSMVIPRKTLRTVRIIGIAALALILILSFAVSIFVQI